MNRFPGLIVLAILAQPGLPVTAQPDPIPDLGPTGSPCAHEGVVIRSCGEIEVPVEARAVVRAADGGLVPVRGVEVYRVDHALLRSEGGLERMPVRVSRSGRFRFSAWLADSTTTSCTDGIVKTGQVTLSEQYLLRAPGCTDAHFEVSSDWSAGDIVMVCPDR